MNKLHVLGTIDRAIKETWLYSIQCDYYDGHLLKEDTLKNSIYFHLRNRLSAAFLEMNHIRIFTEYQYHGSRADIAIVRLHEDYDGYLGDAVAEVLAVIELKYKASGATIEHFQQDIIKVQNYVHMSQDEQTQYYLAFIHEYTYDEDAPVSWMTEEQAQALRSRVTELCAYYQEGHDEMQWQIVSDNGWNGELTTVEKVLE